MASQFFITGYVKFTPSEKPLSDVKVEIWEEHVPYGYLSGSVTDKAGYFSCFINETIATLMETPGEVELKYIVKKDGVTIAENALTGPFLDPVEIAVSSAAYDLVVPMAPPADATPYSLIKIKGRIYDVAGLACPDRQVDVYEIGFREKTLVTSAVTDKKGNYQAEINTRFLGNAVNANRTIRVEVSDGVDVIGSSDDILHLNGDVVADIVINTYDDTTEFLTITNQIQAIIGAETIDAIILDLDTGVNEIKYVANATGHSEETILAVVYAYKYAATTFLPADVLYALLKITGDEHNPLLAVNAHRLPAIINNAMEANIISAYDEPTIESFVELAKNIQIENLKATEIVGEAYTINQLMSAIFDGVIDPLDLQDTVDEFLEMQLQGFDGVEEFLREYELQTSFALASRVRLGLRVAAITNYMPPIIKQVLSVLGSNHISTLAELTEAEWVTLIDIVCTAESSLCVPAGIRGEITDPHDVDVQEAYARRLASITQAIFPLANILLFLQGLTGDTVIADSGIRDQVVAFLDNNRDFDTRATSIMDINNVDYDLTDVTDLEELQAGLEGIARISRVAGGNPFAIIKLLQDGLSSATAVAALGWDLFTETYEYLFSPVVGSPAGPCATQEVPGLVPNVSEAFERAVNIANNISSALGGVVTSFTNVYPEVTAGDVTEVVKDIPMDTYGISYPHAVSSGGTVGGSSGGYPLAPSTGGSGSAASGSATFSMPLPATLVPPTSGFDVLTKGAAYTSSPLSSSVSFVSPTLAALFGSLDYTICNDCKSLYGPGAYLADTLHFLKTDNPTLYAKLNEEDRRPDIKYIDLTCDNANTTLPYIDIVNELLEVKVLKKASLPVASNVSLTTKTISKISKVSKEGISTMQSSSAAGMNAVQGPVKPTANKNIAFGLAKAADNNVQVFVNASAVQPAAPQTSADASSVNIPLSKINTQAAYPEKLYRDRDDSTSVDPHKDFTAYTVPTTSRTTYEKVYEDLLPVAVYPHVLPFNMPMAEARVYLNHFGTSRLEMMKLFRPVNPSSSSTPPTISITDYTIYSELLGISQTTASIIDGSHSNFSSNAHLFYGANAANTPNYIDPIDGTTMTGTATDAWQDKMSARIDVLIQQAGISYNELLQFLSTSYLNPLLSGSDKVRRIGVKPHTGAANDTPKLDKLKLTFNTAVSGTTITSVETAAAINSTWTNFSPNFYKKLHSFIRLYRAGNISIYHLDILFRSMMLPATSGLANAIDAAAYKQIVRILKLADELNVQPEVLAMWWNDADTVNYINYPQNSSSLLTSVYQDIFNNKSVINNAAGNIFANPAATALDDYDYTGNTAQIANVCGIRENEVIDLLAYLGVSLDTDITLAVLSRLYVIATLAQNWQYTIADLIDILKLANISISTGNITTATGSGSSALDTYLNNLQAVVDVVQAVSISGLTAAEIKYLVADASAENRSAPPKERIKSFFEAIRLELYKCPVFIDNRDSGDDEISSKSIAEFDKLAKIVYQHFSNEFGVTIAEAQKILDITKSGPGDDGIIGDLIKGKFVVSTFGLSESIVGFIDGFDPELLDGDDKFPETYEVSGDTLQTPKEVVGNYQPDTQLVKLYRAYRFFHKIALIYLRLSFREKEFMYLFDSMDVNPLSFDFTDLPVYIDSSNLKNISGTTISSSTSTILFNGLLRVSRVMDLLELLKLRDDGLKNMLETLRGININVVNETPVAFGSTTSELNEGLANLLTILKQGDKDTKLDELLGNYTTGSGNVTKYGASGPDSLLAVKFAFGASGDFNFGVYKNISMVINAVTLAVKCKRVGLQPASLVKLLTENITTGAVRPLILAANAKYAPADWEKVSKTLRDPLRIKQRDAMVAYLRKKPNDLFAELLLDPEMSPCMMTSRIKQAISSVQLFVDRVVMGLEKSGSTVLALTPSSTVQWQNWRKWYRIWEANRKVFFYPEDWMQPELRDDKTPFFQELEEELKQNAITMENAEKAIANYLLKLDEVAKLQPVGSCDQVTANSKAITHVFARSYGASRTYFHRKIVQNNWTAWDKIDLQIEGDHVVPFVWNNRLFLFWLSFIEKAAPFTTAMRAISPTAIPDNYKEWFWNYADDIDGTVSTSTTTVNNFYKKLEININWAEYKNGEWKESTRSKDSVSLNINPFLEQMIKDGNATAKSIFRELRNANAQDITNFIKSRIFLYPYVYDGIAPTVAGQGVGTSGNAYNIVKGDLYMTVTFPTFKAAFSAPAAGSTSGSTFAEYADYVKAFRFSSSTNNVDVINNSMLFLRVNPPLGTYFKDQAMVSVEPGYELLKSTVQNAVSSSPSNFFYDYDKMDSTAKRVSTSSIPVMTLTPLTANARVIAARTSNFRIVPQSGFRRLALDAPFFFEDNSNTFFVTKTAFSQYFATGNYQAITGLAASSAAALDSVSKSGIASKAYFPPDLFSIDVASGTQMSIPKYYFRPFYHHHVHLFRRMVNQYGAKGLYRPDQLGISGPLPVVQAGNEVSDDTIDFRNRYTYLAPAPNVPNTPETYLVNVNTPYPKNNVDFKYDGAYAVYNWELFFHIPMLIAQRLSENMQFFEAQKWFHYIFDPTSANYLNNETPTSGNQKFWKFYPFYSTAGLTSPPTLELLMTQIKEASGTPGTPAAGPIPAIPAVAPLNTDNHQSAKRQVDAYKERPFEPFVLGRLRPVAFMKYVVAKYIENLIAWGDNLFSRDTMESINEATQLYIMASNLLGKRPVGSVQRVSSKPMAYADFINSASPDIITQASVKVENFLSPSICLTGSGAAPYGFMNYFCMMPNEKLFAYWDIVEDRLFKIRNCQNLQGIVQNRSLFDTPIDPSILVQGFASGMSMDEMMNDLAGDTPAYRFTYMVQKANEFVGDVKALGGALLSAMEKQDAEELALIRQGQEVSIQNAMLQIKQKQIDEAKANYDSILKSKENAMMRVVHYSKLIASGLNRHEKSYLGGLEETISIQKEITALQKFSQALAYIPQFHGQVFAGVGPSYGGQHIANAIAMRTTKLTGEMQVLGTRGNMISTMGGHLRREQEWDFQVKTAEAEAALFEKQLIAANIKIKISEADYNNQVLQIENALTVEAYMKVKYTNKQLYNWLVNQISNTYRMAYNLAYDMARKAHSSYKWELPQSTMAKTNLIHQVWDSRKKGLLAGEILQADIRNMEKSYIEDNKRVYELTRHVSLCLLDPVALAQLRMSGYCEIAVPEEWYDFDFPGHLNRTIKSVSLSIPCVSGPYATIPCTLSLMASSRRMSISSNLEAVPKPPCNRIAFTTGQNDAGLFEANMKDERYLPFEGAGAISSWSISLFNAPPTTPEDIDLVQPPLTSFDLDSISDVILHIRYTAQDSASELHNASRREAVETYLAPVGEGEANMARLFSLKHDFYNDWYNYLNTLGEASPALNFQLNINHFPMFCLNKEVRVVGIRMASRLNDPATSDADFEVTGSTQSVPPGIGVDLISTDNITANRFSSLRKVGGDTDLSGEDILITRSEARSFTLHFGEETAELMGKLRNVYFIVLYQLA